MSGFDGTRVLVVGGSSGIGQATAAAFAAAGANVTIASRSKAKLDAAIKAIGAASAAAPVTAVELDITDDAAVSAYFGAGEPWDHVVISAAQTPGGPARQLPLADAYSAMNSKFWGAYRIARLVRIREAGSLTLISGYLAVRPRATSVLQGAINAALEALGRGLALELSPVRVNTVSPGLIATPLWDRISLEAREAMYAETAQRLPARRVGQSEDIAHAVLYLAGNRFATGSTILVDGGAVIA
jgi:NAD(P)-dependent dehydrogenase (short-subunit alcohol dehydrogenase family)